MPDAFFQKKRKRTVSGSSGSGSRGSSSSFPRSRANGAGSTSSSGPSSSRSAGGAQRRSRRDESDEEDDGDFDLDKEDTRHRYEEDISSDEEREEAETPAEARVRMAKMYLEGLKGPDLDPDDADAALADQENISDRLQKDVSEQSGRLHVFVSSKLVPTSRSNILLLSGGHRGSLTAAVASNNGRYVYTAAKDGTVIRWRMADGRMDVLVPRRRSQRQHRQHHQSTKASVNDDSADHEIQPALTATAEVEVESVSVPKSKSSGASRRKARREASLVNSKELKGKGKAVAPGSPQACELIDVGLEEGHDSEVLSLAISSDGKYLVTGGTDKRVGVWSVSDTSIVDSSSGQTVRWVKALVGHKDSISGLKFKSSSHELYTASLDRTMKLFDVDQLSYIETLFGHQESIHALDALKNDFAVTAGGRDRTARWWKIRDESQLVFRGGAKNKMREVMEGGDLIHGEDGKRIRGDRGGSIIEGSLDAVAMIDDQHFLTGGDSGAISLWSLAKKKPIFTRAATHGFDVKRFEEGEDDILQPRWVTSLACLPYGDVFASGSWDGCIRLWALDSKLRSFKKLFDIPAKGFVNSLQLLQPPRSSLQNPVIQPSLWRHRSKGKADDGDAKADDGDEGRADAANLTNGRRGPLGGKESVPPILVAAIGQEPRLGRWMKMKSANSAGLVVPLTFASDQAQ
ncbi:unnamed protein product [Sympodiomycopsis kandeliae]